MKKYEVRENMNCILIKDNHAEDHLPPSKRNGPRDEPSNTTSPSWGGRAVLYLYKRSGSEDEFSEQTVQRLRQFAHEITDYLNGNEPTNITESIQIEYKKPNKTIEIPVARCAKCGHTWKPRTSYPVVCPKCQTRRWRAK